MQMQECTSVKLPTCLEQSLVNMLTSHLEVRSQSFLNVCKIYIVVFILVVSTFVGTAWPFGLFIPPQRPMTSDFIHYIYFPILIFGSQYFPF